MFGSRPLDGLGSIWELQAARLLGIFLLYFDILSNNMRFSLFSYKFGIRFIIKPIL